MNLQQRNLSDLRVYSNNPRNNSGAIAKVKESIRRYGYKVPIVVDANNEIVAGHTRFAALRELVEEGLTQFESIQVLIADDLTDQQIKEFRIVDNQVAALAEWDFTALKIELGGLDDFDIDDFGFIPGFDTELVIPEDTINENTASTGKIKIQVGDYKYEMEETDYHRWASTVVGQSGKGVLEFVLDRLQIDQYEDT